MSFEAMTWAVKQKLPSTQKLVLLMLCDRINKDTGDCIPRIKLLADDCGLSESGVKKTLKELEQKGLIKVQARFKDGVQLANRYGVTMCGGGSPDNPGWVTKKPRVGHQVTTEPGILNQGSLTNIPPNPQTGETIVEEKQKPKSETITLKTFLDQCKENGVDAVPKDDPVFKNAQDSGLPIEFVALAWAWFKDKYLHSKKRYKDWRRAFRNSVNDTWGRLWWYDSASNEYRLTTTGVQFKTRISAQEAAEC